MIRISTVINLALTLQLSYLRSLLFFTIVRESESYYTPYTSLARERLKGSAADLVQISRSHSSQSTLASRIASKNPLKKEYQNNRFFIPHPYLIPRFTLPKLLSRSRQETFAP